MKIIHCNIWGDIQLSDLAIQIIDTPHFQRLHYIKQTGFAYKVFPSAMTSRFEHSLGVYHATRLLLNHIMKIQKELEAECDERKQELICIAGLVHDIGHGPYSHLFDRFLLDTKSEWKCHEKRGIDIFRNLVVTNEVSLTEEEINFISDLVLGCNRTQWYHQIVNNSYSGLDTDKIDYVLRDTKNFGMNLCFDPYRIILNCRVINNELCFCDRIRDEIVTIFLIRNKMNRFIYRHRKICEFENVFLFHVQSPLFHDIIDCIESQNVEQFLQWNDYNLLFRIKDWSSHECRKSMKEFQPLPDEKEFKDQQWYKMKNIAFYSKKNPNQKFLFQDWNIQSCY